MVVYEDYKLSRLPLGIFGILTLSISVVYLVCTRLSLEMSMGSRGC